MWITDKSNALTYAGVATCPPFSGLIDLPNNSTDTTNGIWCYTKVIGSNSLFPSGTYIAPFIDGRTLTHEVGHYVGLRHIWGDRVCGNDFCNDTPPAAAQNSGTPTYPHEVGSCASPSNNPDGEMFMNFMDYTRGPNVYMITTDQKTRAHTAMQNSPFRNQLGTHSLCTSTTGLNTINLTSFFKIYPNPAQTQLNLIISQGEIEEVSISNLIGQVLFTLKNNNTIDISNLSAGIYLVTVRQGPNILTQKFIKQ